MLEKREKPWNVSELAVLLFPQFCLKYKNFLGQYFLWTTFFAGKNSVTNFDTCLKRLSPIVYAANWSKDTYNF